MNPAKIVIADDNQDAIDILVFFVKQLPDYRVVGTCRNGEQLIELVMLEKPDLVLADISMPIMNGIDSIRHCLTFAPNLQFIFVTSYDQYAVKAFEIAAVDYLVKPIEKPRLYSALEKFKQYMLLLKPETAEFRRLHITFGSTSYYIPVNSIILVEKIGRKCYIHTTEAAYETYENISALNERLTENRFYMPHRSYIVNIWMISKIISQKNALMIHFFGTNQIAYAAKSKFQEIQHKLCKG